MKKSSLNKRVLAAFIDFLIIAAVQGVIFMAIVFTSIGEPVNLNALLIVTGINSLLYFCKDMIGGQSVGKRFCRLQIVRGESSRSVSLFILFLRNITIPLWPIELYMLYRSNGEKRLGDRFFNTSVVSK